jgi:general stress protein 26
MGAVDAASWLAELQDASFARASRAMRAAYPPDRRMTGAELAAFLNRRTYAVASTTRPDGRAHAAPTLFTLSDGAFWLPTLGDAARLRNVRAYPWLALSIVEGEHETHAAVLAEGSAEVLTAAPQSVWETTRRRNQAHSLDWATAWLRMTPERLLSFAEVAWAGTDVRC